MTKKWRKMIKNDNNDKMAKWQKWQNFFFKKKKIVQKRISLKNLSKTNKNSIKNKMMTDQQTSQPTDIAAYRVALQATEKNEE